MSFSCGSIHQGLVPERFSDESWGIRDVYVSINQILLHRDNISLCMQQKWCDGQKFFFSEQTTTDSSLLVSGEKRGKMRSKSALRLKRLRYHMRLIKEFFVRWGVKFDRCAKISARWGKHSADNLTMDHICPLRRKESLEPYGFKMRIAVWSRLTPG